MYLILILLILIILVVCYISKNSDKEKYGTDYQYGDYKLMSHLPWCTPPTGIGALGRTQCCLSKQKYPGKRYLTNIIPYISCDSHSVPAVINETGNSANPNTTNSWGIITQDDIPW